MSSDFAEKSDCLRALSSHIQCGSVCDVIGWLVGHGNRESGRLGLLADTFMGLDRKLRTVTRSVSEEQRRFLADASGYCDPLLAFCATSDQGHFMLVSLSSLNPLPIFVQANDRVSLERLTTTMRCPNKWNANRGELQVEFDPGWNLRPYEPGHPAQIGSRRGDQQGIEHVKTRPDRAFQRLESLRSMSVSAGLAQIAASTGDRTTSRTRRTHQGAITAASLSTSSGTHHRKNSQEDKQAAAHRPGRLRSSSWDSDRRHLMTASERPTK